MPETSTLPGESTMMDVEMGEGQPETASLTVNHVLTNDVREPAQSVVG